MVINAPYYCNEALASPKQTALGKDIPKPLMTDSLPKTMKVSLNQGEKELREVERVKI